MSRGPARRPVRQGEANRVIDALRAEIGAKTGQLLDRYHLMHVYPLEVRLRWRERAWPVRLWLWLTRRKPDAWQLAAKALEDWDRKHLKQRCAAERPDGPETCALLAGHDGPHGATRQTQVEGLEPVVTWESEPEPEAGDAADG